MSNYVNPYWSGLSSGMGAGQAFGNPNQFSMNSGVMGGAIGGAASGAAAGPVGAGIGAVVGGATAFFKQDAQLKQNVDNVNTSFNMNYDAYGRPVYNSQGFAQGVDDLRGMMEATRPGAHAMRPRRRRQMERKAGELYSNLTTGQQNFNQSESRYRDRQLQLQDYYNKQNDNSQLYNLYRFG